MTRLYWFRIGLFCIPIGVALASGCATVAPTNSAPAPAGAAAAAGSPASRAAPLPSKVINATDLVGRPSDIGEQWPIIRSPTGTLDELEIHMTTLKPGMAPHPPHQHPYEEMVVLKEGTLEVTINGHTSTATGSAVLYFAPNDLHGWRNVGSTSAMYWVITWHTRPGNAAR